MKYVYALAVVLFFGAVALCFRALVAPRGQIVEVIQKGRAPFQIDLSAEKKSRTIKLESPDGGYNVLLIEDGKIRVESADCRGQDCVKMGYLRSPSLPLICLPHSLTVRFVQSDGALDSVSQ